MTNGSPSLPFPIRLGYVCRRTRRQSSFKPMANGHGGPRPGAGRKPTKVEHVILLRETQPNRYEAISEATDADLTPLAVMHGEHGRSSTAAPARSWRPSWPCRFVRMPTQHIGFAPHSGRDSGGLLRHAQRWASDLRAAEPSRATPRRLIAVTERQTEDRNPPSRVPKSGNSVADKNWPSGPWSCSPRRSR